MKNRFLILFLVVATLFACSSDSMSNDGFDETAEKRSGVPFKAKKLVGTYEFGPNVNNSIECGGGLFSLNAFGEGTVSHLGKTAVLEEWCWTGANDDLGTRYVTFTAANGDMLKGKITKVDIEEETPFIIREEVTITEGSGRFANAKGAFSQIIEITPPQPSGQPFPLIGTFTYSAEGTISY